LAGTRELGLSPRWEKPGFEKGSLEKVFTRDQTQTQQQHEWKHSSGGARCSDN